MAQCLRCYKKSCSKVRTWQKTVFESRETKFSNNNNKKKQYDSISRFWRLLPDYDVKSVIILAQSHLSIKLYKIDKD